MSQQLTVEIPDDVYETLRQEASAVGTPPAELAANVIEQEFGSTISSDPRSREEQEDAREQFRRVIGSVDMGTPLGIDNEQIDSDLVREHDADADDEEA